MGKVVTMRVPARSCWDSEESLDQRLAPPMEGNPVLGIMFGLLIMLAVVGVVALSIWLGGKL